jgi:uncharacterized protein
MHSEILWRSLDDEGFEHVRIDDRHPGWTVFDSMFVRVHEGAVKRGGYTLIVDKAWNTLELRIMVEGAPGEMMAQHVLASGDGRWTDANERHIPSLDGVRDVDIQWSPLTNTLPVNRLRMSPGDEHDITVAYFSLPDLGIKPVRQHYTSAGNGIVRYASETRDFERDLTVDDQGFVLEYPDLFSRSFPMVTS